MREDKHRTPHGETPYSPVSLLRALTANPLDVDALRGTDGAHEKEHPPTSRASRALTPLLAIGLGFIVAVSVVELRASAAAEDSPHALLTEQVRESRAEADALEARHDELQDDVAAAQEEMLEGGDPAAAERLSAYEQSVGSVALTGPGVTLTLDDSAPLPAAPGVADGTVNRVSDADLQIAVNGLWAAGAEGIAINGQRLSGTSAIRTAGSAVLVDFRPLSPPYEVTALGDPDQLLDALADGETGDYLAEITQRFGIRTDREASDDLTVPVRTEPALHEASPIAPERDSAPASDDPPIDDPERNP